jgi:alanine dehydrogenase
VRIGVPREVKDSEYRVALTPGGVQELVHSGHAVALETGAGAGSAIPDAEYEHAGATIVGSAEGVWADADLVLKVKEPVREEYHRLRPGLVLFTYLHLAADAALTDELCRREVTALAYETVELPDHRLPLLAPMSEVAGRLAPQVGAQALLAPSGGRGLLLAGVPGVREGRVAVLGAGVAGRNATAIAVGLGASVVVLDRDLNRLREIDHDYTGRVHTVASSAYEIERAVLQADLVIGAVLIPGAKAPRLVSNALVARMRPGSVLVDVSIDQGGCFEDSRPTTHADPTFRVHDSVFYCVANMPGAVPNTSTHALTNATLPYVLAVADQGWRDACRADPALAKAVNTSAGMLVSEPVAAAHGRSAVPLADVLADS